MAIQRSTNDGLTICYDPPRAAVTGVRLGGRELPRVAARAGFVAHDVAVWSRLHGFSRGRCEPLGLDLEAKLTVVDGAIRVSGRVVDTTGDDRAVTLTFSLPVDAAGWTWHDDPRSRREIQPGRTYTNEIDVGSGATGMASLYPFACISDGRRGLALGMDMDCPAQVRLAYDAAAGRLTIAYDVGLSGRTQQFPHAAPFAFVIYSFDGRWGFRSAAEKFYRLFPDHFVCRSKDQGIWMPFGDVSDVKGWEDFGFKYHEGVSNVAFDNAAGVLVFRYCEPSTFWMPMDPAQPRTDENVMAELQAWADSDDPARRRQAAAVLAAGSFNERGQLNYRALKKPWCDGVVFSLNPNPNLPGENEASLYWNDRGNQRYYGPTATAPIDGEYLDSLEAYVTAEENFRQDHYQHVTAPLAFSRTLRRPMIHKASSVWELVKQLGRELRAMGKLLFANDSPNRFAYLCPHLDVMGMEIGWIDDEGLFRPPDDAWMMFKRVMCRHKPFLFLLNTHFDRCGPETMAKYIQRCLFYGMFPSMFSHNACDGVYWGLPKLIERDRPLFRKYLPLIKRVAEAGWEPVTRATVDNEAVHIERFGPDESGRAYLTLLNDSGRAQRAGLSVSADTFGGPAAAARNAITGRRIKLTTGAGQRTASLTLRPQQVCVLAFGGDGR